jgi:CDP-glucose 4,6-dehydratase
VYDDFYRGRRVLVTGHTGFKGAWLALWLRRLGAEVTGYADRPPTTPSLFDAAGLAGALDHVEGRLEDRALLAETFARCRPEVVFHLAGQALVSVGHESPHETFLTNVQGTVNVLQAACDTASVRGVVSITSDKCYENREWIWGYREIDALGGDDAYSLSKAGAELAIRAYQLAPKAHPTLIASARAGNVVGGGDWALDRLVPDATQAFAEGRTLTLRRPQARRPWQHVLDPLSGYLLLGARLAAGDRDAQGAWNFGPSPAAAATVAEVIDLLASAWGTEPQITTEESYAENQLLRLDTEKARQHLGWSVSLDLAQTMALTAQWYKRFYEHADQDAIVALTHDQMDTFTATAQQRGMTWA